MLCTWCEGETFRNTAPEMLKHVLCTFESAKEYKKGFNELVAT